MTALDDALATGRVAASFRGTGVKRDKSWAASFGETAVHAAVKSGFLIPRDDIEGLLKALGAELWMFGPLGLHKANDGCVEFGCRPVYAINPPTKESC